MAKKIQTKEKQPGSKKMFAFSRENYIILIVGLLVIFTGFALMVGGGSDDPNVYSDAIFSFRRLTLAPILVLGGFVIEIFAIMYRPKTSEK